MRLALQLILYTFFARATDLTVNFTDLSQRDSTNTNLVWNSFFNYLHPPLVVDSNSGDALDTEDYIVDVGNGTDGAFDVSTYSLFSVNGSTAGNLITIDTNAHPNLNLTYFYLAPGWTIKGQGTNPLSFKVLGSFTNTGTITCSADDGDPITSDYTSTAQGGRARCGGGRGGNGGNATSNGSDGQLNGGFGSNSSSAGGTYATGGGGGGGYRGPTANSSGGGGGTPGGGAGSCNSEDNMVTFGNNVGGGGGGGGGGAYTVIDGNQSRGGAGGGGGGMIHIVAVGDVTNTGSILARGGAGGGSSSAAGAGSGGGGGGGSIWIQSAGNIVDNGNMDSRRGTGGAATFPGNGTGGNGCGGRTWFTAYNGSPSGTGTEQPGPLLGGEVHYSEGLYTAQTNALDIKNTKPDFRSVSILSSLPGTSTAIVWIAGSNDRFVNDNTGFILTTGNLGPIQGKRWVKFKFQLQLTMPAPGVGSTNATTPATINSVVVQYIGVKQTEFNFTPTCGTMSGPGEFGFWSLVLAFLTILFRRGRLILRRTTRPNLDPNPS